MPSGDQRMIVVPVRARPEPSTVPFLTIVNFTVTVRSALLEPVPLATEVTD